MSSPRAHVALLVDFANLRQRIRSSGDHSAPEGGLSAGSDGAPPAGSARSSAAQANRAAVGTNGPLSSSAGKDGAAPGLGASQIARSLVRFAGSVGRVGLARAYADWSREPELARQLNGTRLAPVLVPATEDGEDRSHIRLVVDAMEALYNGDEPDAFVLVSSDPSLVPLVQAIRADGSEVILVAADGEAAEEMRAESDQFATFDDVLDGLEGEPVRPRSFADRERGPGGGRGAEKAGREERGGRDRGFYSRMPLLTESNFDDYEWEGFIRLIDELEQRLPFVGVRYLVNKVLGPHNCGIDDPHIKRDLINVAVDDGLIEMYTVGNVNDRTDPVTACRLDRQSPRVARTLGASPAEAEDMGRRAEEAQDEYSTTTP